MRIYLLGILLSCSLSLLGQSPFFFEDAREAYQKVEINGKILAAFREGAEYLRIDDRHYLYLDQEKTGVYELQEQGVKTSYIESDERSLEARMVQKEFKALSPKGVWHFPESRDYMYPLESAPALADSLLVAAKAERIIYYKDKILKIVAEGKTFLRLDDSTFFYYEKGKAEGRYRLSEKLDTLYDINPFTGVEETHYYLSWHRIGPWYETKQKDGRLIKQMGHYVKGQRSGFWRHFDDASSLQYDTLWFYEGRERRRIPSVNKIYEADTLQMEIPGRWWVWEWQDDLQAIRSETPPAFAQYEWEIEAHGRSRIRRIGSKEWKRLRYKIWEEKAGLLELRVQQDYLGNNYKNSWLQQDVMWWYGSKSDFLQLILGTK